MSAIAINAEGLGKRYLLGTRGASYQTLRDSVSSAARRSMRLLGSRGASRVKAEPNWMWALKDVSFQVPHGAVVGLIGRNGAGKSTLLKVLSRITEPTSGFVDLRGRVGSLLEVGTGFHPELTGRENIFLSGAILGMRRADILRKFDEILAFAEVEKFVETPVKHYSSGMYLRLAFAVAAHLEPEILLVDEVLAVGDARFQRKCMDKMQDVSHRGSTVLFVSHSMPAITRLCERAILLNDGQIVQDGPADQVVAAYLSSALGTSAAREWPELATAPGTGVTKLRAVRVVNRGGDTVDTIDIKQPVGIALTYDVLEPGHVLLPHYSVHNSQGVFAFVALDQDAAWRGKPRPAGRYTSTGWIPGNFLSEGMMLVGPAMRALEPDVLHFYERDAVSFQVVDSPGGLTARGDYPGGIPGAVRPLLEWSTSVQAGGLTR